MEDRLVRIAAVWLLPTAIVLGGAIVGPRSHDAIAYFADALCVLFALAVHDALRDIGRETSD